MKAVKYTEYGPPEVLQLTEVRKPEPKDNEVLIKIYASTVNRTDCGFRKPEYPVIIRLVNGLFKPKRMILGNELAGEIEAIGKNVKLYKPGDQVFGLSTSKFGAHAEYICMPETGSFAIKPANISYNEAAGVCDGLMLAITYIRKIDFSGKIKILINGASGSIGSACVQLARNYGAEITAVCDTRNVDLVKTLGADEVIDFIREDFTKSDKNFDVVMDAVGKSSFFRCRKILKPGGIYFSTEPGFLAQNILLAICSSILNLLPGGRTRRKVKFPIPEDSKEDIALFKELIEAGRYIAVIDRCYTLDNIIDATRYVETGKKAGNVVITMQ